MCVCKSTEASEQWIIQVQETTRKKTNDKTQDLKERKKKESNATMNLARMDNLSPKGKIEAREKHFTLPLHS